MRSYFSQGIFIVRRLHPRQESVLIQQQASQCPLTITQGRERSRPRLTSIGTEAVRPQTLEQTNRHLSMSDTHDHDTPGSI